MSAQIIPFPRTQIERLRFGAWLTDRVGGRWVVVKQRRKTWRGIDMSNRVQLLEPQYEAFERLYEAKFGPIYQEV